ncbi:LysM peptidoglycan-binding domain-containing protein [bacterium]|nr:LysM peptidoglycan-binding domain-containing protein [bacterium]
MKIPSAAKYPIAIGLMALMTSCDDPKKPQGKVQQKLTTAELAREAEFGPWMSKAGLMFAQEQLPTGDYFAEIEGRINKGENQYRVIQQKLDTEKYLNAEAMWGLEADPLFQHEISRLRRGMERSWSQVFTDSTGKAIHQLVMVLPIGAQVEDAVSSDLASVEGSSKPPIEAKEVIPATLSADLEEGTSPTSPPGIVTSEVEDLPDSVDSSGDALVVSPEVTPLVEVNGEAEVLPDPVSESAMTEPETNSTEDDGGTSAGLESVIGGLDTPEPDPVAEGGSESEEPETPARGVVVEDDESSLETSDNESEPETATETEAAPPASDEPDPEPLPKLITYKVERGDTLSGISRRYKVSVSAIKKASGFRSDMLRIGQILKIPAE